MNEIVIPAAKRIRTGIKSQMCFEVPEFIRDVVWHLIATAHERKIEYFQVTIRLPQKKRSLEQNNHFHGHVQQITIETGNDFEDTKLGIKIRALDMGYPYTMIDGIRYPKPSHNRNTKEMSILIEVAHLVAAEYGIRLKEE